nr:hypothetical protein [Tanacetum cinerariifolium]
HRRHLWPPSENFFGGLFPANPKRLPVSRSIRSPTPPSPHCHHGTPPPPSTSPPLPSLHLHTETTPRAATATITPTTAIAVPTPPLPPPPTPPWLPYTTGVFGSGFINKGCLFGFINTQRGCLFRSQQPKAKGAFVSGVAAARKGVPFGSVYCSQHRGCVWFSFTAPREQCEDKGIVPTKMELLLEQSQQGSSHEVSYSAATRIFGGVTEMELVLEQTQKGTSHEVSVSTEGVEELKRKVKIKGENKEAILTLMQKPVMRTASAAAKPCQGDFLEFYLITDSIYTD